MVIPPPNVTGSLHLGHALNTTLQDILARWKRMQGFNVLWVPGTDHAGIATQNVVERQLAKEGKSRHDIGRDPFVKKIWDWKESSGGTIIGQLKRLGASCDWSRERFTLDEGLSSAVTEVFVKLYHEGLIYRDNRLIHFCFRCNTALSDIEVEHEEVQGKMYHIRYPLADGSDSLIIATTRPETMLADMAVAVHPDDPRYNHLIGKEVALPLTTRTIPIVGDAILVDREFGTGAVKITPGHDFNDEQAGKRHGLKAISLPVLEDRKTVVKQLEDKQLLVKEEDHRHAIGVCYRCKTVVEPHLSTQWFVRMNDPKNSLVVPAIEAVKGGQIQLIPEGWKNNYLGWMENIQDWCISRQIWWGHQIPAWYCVGNDKAECKLACEAPIVSRILPENCPHCGSTDLRQDSDVLDTWFSSALWPFSTLGWGCDPSEGCDPREPKETEELKRFYPTNTLISGFDILFFWVARMIMMGLHFTGKIPFKDVYIHALVRDAEGKKMSKSKGNVIDPLEIMSRYGTDALRFTLASMASPGRDIRLAEERIEGYRNFANKLWNAARFVEMQRSEGDLLSEGLRARRGPKTCTLPASRWIRYRLRETVDAVNTALSEYRFDEAAGHLYKFTWHTYCDWYLELSKVDIEINREETLQVLNSTLHALLRLLHPFMPFITEEIAACLSDKADCLGAQRYPEKEDFPWDPEIELYETWVIATISSIRNFIGEMNIPAKELTSIFIHAESQEAVHRYQAYLVPYFQRLMRTSATVTIGTDMTPPKRAATISIREGKVYISLGENHLKSEKGRLEKALMKLEQEWVPIQAKYDDVQFITKAPALVVAKLDLQKTTLIEKRNQIKANLQKINLLLSETETAP